MATKVDQEGQIPNDVVVDQELHDITPVMLDWWFVNAEKGYPLWEPNEHKSFRWDVPPGRDTYVGAIAIVDESIGGGDVHHLRMEIVDLSLSPIPVIYEHAALSSALGPNNERTTYLLHQYEATSYGTRLRSTMHFMVPMPSEFGETWARHCRAEFGTLTDWLPQFYKLWQVVKDPAINRRISLKVKK